MRSRLEWNSFLIHAHESIIRQSSNLPKYTYIQDNSRRTRRPTRFLNETRFMKEPTHSLIYIHTGNCMIASAGGGKAYITTRSKKKRNLADTHAQRERERLLFSLSLPLSGRAETWMNLSLWTNGRTSIVTWEDVIFASSAREAFIYTRVYVYTRRRPYHTDSAVCRRRRLRRWFSEGHHKNIAQDAD